MPEVPDCPLCKYHGSKPFAPECSPGTPMPYFHCPRCDLRFLHPNSRLSAADEKARYMNHENGTLNAGYRKFLEPVFYALKPRLTPGVTGLDFGCGPGSGLREIFSEQQFELKLYDPFFAPNPDALARQYDFITATEVAEHFHHPAAEFAKLFQLLNPGGHLALMTLLFDPSIDFASWYYRRDPTHVVFYSRTAFAWIAKRFGFEDLAFHGERTVTLRRPT